MDTFSFLTKHITARAYSYKNGDQLFSRLRDINRSQWMSLDMLKKIQLERLKRLLIHAFESVKYYQDTFNRLGFDPYRFCDLSQLQALPFLRKSDIVDSHDLLISSRYSKDVLVKSRTGGSTGTKLHFLIDKKCVDERNACAWRHNRWADWDIGMPVAAIWGNPKSHSTLKAKVRTKFLYRMKYLDTMNMTKCSMNQFAQTINKLCNYALYGHSHSIYLFAKFIEDEDIRVISPTAIVTTSMMLMGNERQFIEDVFGLKVTDRYGCEEVGLVASECELHRGMHLNVDHLVIEFVREDGSSAMPGEEGRIVITDLMNYGMPFIRYEVGDVGVLSDRVCTCGRGLPLMEKVSGRTADFLVRNDGSLVAGVSLIERLLTNIPGIQQMQIVQNNTRSIQLHIVKGKDFSQTSTLVPLREEFEKVFPGTEMLYDFLEKIPQEPSGKYRFAICNIE